MKKHHFFNMYFTTTISISLVLFLVGLECALLFTTNELKKYVQENVSLSIVLLDDSTNTEQARIDNLLKIAPFTKSVTYISKEDALQEHIQSLGENPEEFLGYNPLLASFEVKLTAPYAHTDSIKMIERKLKPFTSINRIIYQKDMIDVIDNNINHISGILLILAVVMLLIALALINNTIRLNIYSKRFLINTMKLVGATPWIIKAPFIRKNVFIGFIASLIAILGLAGAAYYFEKQTGITFILTNLQMCIFVPVFVVVTGILITFFSSYFAIGKYIRMKTNDLYYI